MSALPGYFYSAFVCVVVIVAAGCSTKPRDAEVAESFLEELEENWTYQNTFMSREEVLAKVTGKGLKPETVRAGAVGRRYWGSPTVKGAA